jgi:hypothetical protein
MDGEQRLIVILTLTAIILLAAVGLVLLIALWPLRLIIAPLLVSFLFLVFLLVIGIAVNEGVLRHKRVKYQRELPLGESGQPLYLYDNMKPYRENDPRYE